MLRTFLSTVLPRVFFFFPIGIFRFDSVGNSDNLNAPTTLTSGLRLVYFCAFFFLFFFRSTAHEWITFVFIKRTVLIFDSLWQSQKYLTKRFKDGESHSSTNNSTVSLSPVIYRPVLTTVPCKLMERDIYFFQDVSPWIQLFTLASFYRVCFLIRNTTFVIHW